MQLDAVEAGLLGAQRRVGKQAGQHLRQFANMRELHVGDALAVAELQRLKLIGRQHSRKLVLAHGAQAGADVGVGQTRQRGAMAIGDGKKALEEFLRLGTAADGQKIDQLDEQARAAFTRPPHRLDQAGKARQEAVMADAKQRSARHVANAGRLDHDRARHPPGEALVPVDDVFGDVALLGRPPRHHGWNPGPLQERYRTDIDGRKQPRRRGLRR